MENNKAVTPAGLNDNSSIDTLFQAAALTFRIADVMYTKSAATDLTIVVGTTTGVVASSKYAAFAVVIDSAGTITTLKGADCASKAKAIAALIDVEIPTDKSVLGFLVVSGAFTAGTTSMTAGTNVDFYSCGGMALGSGLSTDGDNLLAAL